LVTLRPYQSVGIQQIRDAFASGSKAPLYVLPTGGGKTVLFSAIAESSEKRGKRVLILCHRVELVDQIVASLKTFDVNPDIIASGYGRRAGGNEGRGEFKRGRKPGSSGGALRAIHSVTIASVQTLVRRLDSYAPPSLIVIDEAHHVTAGGQWSQILNYYRTAKNLGVTATPMRTDGRGLGAHFDKLIVGPTVAELIGMGYLAPPRIFAPPTVDTSGLHIRAGDFKHEEAEALMDAPSITGDALSHYRRHANGLPALVFCTSVAHAHHVAERFRSENIAAVALDGSTDKDLRRIAVQDFRDGKIKILASCDLFSEGFDVPGVHCGIFLRPTASMGLYLQQVGRILRPAPGKTHAICLDHAGNTERFGMPDQDREWILTADVIKKKKPGVMIRVCPKCFAASPARSMVCRECGVAFETKPRQELEEKEGELVELTAEQIAAKRERQMQGRAQSLEQLRAFGKSKGYSANWADFVWKARIAKRNKEIA
jgi:DNA repair protein RadD